MKKLCFCLFIFLNYPLFSQTELEYDIGSRNLPKWVNLMYSYDVKISTSLGKSIYNKSTNEGTQKIDLSKYPKGIYILEVNSSGYKE